MWCKSVTARLNSTWALGEQLTGKLTAAIVWPMCWAKMEDAKRRIVSRGFTGRHGSRKIGGGSVKVPVCRATHPIDWVASLRHQPTDRRDYRMNPNCAYHRLKEKRRCEGVHFS